VPIIKHIQKQDYTVVDNACLRDPNLDLECRGLLITMLSLPDTWNFTGRGLAAILPCGKTKVFRLLNKLESAGYLKREEIRNDKGQISDTIYYIAATPMFTENPTEENSADKSGKFESDFAENLDVNSQRKCDDRHENCGGKCVENFSNNDSANISLDISTEVLQDTAEEISTTNSDNAILQNEENSCTQPCPHRRDTGKRDTDNRDSNKLYNNKLNTNKLLYTLPTNHNNIEDGLVELNNYREIIKSNISFNDLEISLSESNYQQATEILELMAEVCALNTQPLKINGNLIPAEVVKSRFLKIDHWDIRYILEYLDGQTDKIKNIRAYLISVLFNCKTTKNNYYKVEVNHDLYGNHEGG